MDEFDKELANSNILNLQEKKFVMKYFETEGNRSQACVHAGYGASVNPLKKMHVRAAIEYLMDRKGITDGKLMDVAIEGLGAMKTKYDARGQLLEETPDHAVRHMYWKDLVELKQLMPKREEVVGGGGMNIFLSSEEDKQGLMIVISRLNELNKRLELSGDDNCIEVEGNISEDKISEETEANG